MTTVRVRILLFGKARELTNSSEKIVDLPRQIDHKELRRLIFHEILKELSSIEACSMLALNEEYIADDGNEFVISEDSEIAVIPPLSGG